MNRNELLKLQEESIKEKVYWRLVSKNGLTGFGIYSVIQPDINNYRYYLELDLPEKETGNTLVTLMMNPSKTFPYEERNANIDTTVLNLAKISQSAKINGKDADISKIVVLNTLPIINSNIDIALTALDENRQKYNENFVKAYLKACDKENTIFLAAWGNNTGINKYNKFISTINSEFKNKMYAFCINKEKTPTHPSPFNSAQINGFLKNPELIQLGKINKKLTVSLKKG